MKNSKLLFSLFVIICFILIACKTTRKKSLLEEDFSGKYALVIGNANYKNILKLQNPINDVEDISNVLKQLGFNVELYFDLNFEQMEMVIDKFTKKLSSKNYMEGLIYYAGQGFNINGKNYLVPIDLSASNSVQIISRSYAIGTLFDKLIMADNNLNVVIIDACFTKMTLPLYHHRGVVFFPLTDQNNVPIENDGLESLDKFTKDIFYLQSTLPGKIALDGVDSRNSPFAMALLKNIKKPVKFTELVKDIISDTLEYTNEQQHPYFKGNIFNYENYTINH